MNSVLPRRATLVEARPCLSIRFALGELEHSNLSARSDVLLHHEALKRDAKSAHLDPIQSWHVGAFSVTFAVTFSGDSGLSVDSDKNL